MLLTDIKARGAKAGGTEEARKPRKLADAKGLYLYVAPSGSKSWRFDYRFQGRRQTLVIGPYPEVSLKAARRRHAAARALLEDGANPAAIKQQERQARRSAGANTFRGVAEAWYAELGPHRSRSWRLAMRNLLNNHIYPRIGSRPLESVDAGDVLHLVRRIAETGRASTAENVRWLISRIYNYAIRNLQAKADPALPVRGAIARPPTKHHPSLTSKELPALLRKVETYGGRPETRLALKLLLLTFVRKSELAGARWSELDLDERLWRIRSERMKTKRDHLVPLSEQAIQCVEEARTLAPRSSPFVFCHFGDPKRPMSDETFNVALAKLGYKGKLTPHGIRGTASTILNEQGWNADVIERQLAHIEKDKTRAAYNQAQYLDERREMLQAWADYLDALRTGAKVVNIKAAKR